MDKYYPQQHTHLTEVVPNERIEGQVLTVLRILWENVQNPEPVMSEEGIVNITHGFGCSLFYVNSKLVFDDDCRRAIRGLNHCQSRSVKHLGDGYDVSDIYAMILQYQTLPWQCLEALAFAPTVTDILVKYIDGITSVLFSYCGKIENVTQYTARHAQSMTAWQRVLGQKSRKPWLE